jgi:hypothetical protein
MAKSRAIEGDSDTSLKQDQTNRSIQSPVSYFHCREEGQAGVLFLVRRSEAEHRQQ